VRVEALALSRVGTRPVATKIAPDTKNIAVLRTASCYGAPGGVWRCRTVLGSDPSRNLVRRRPLSPSVVRLNFPVKLSGITRRALRSDIRFCARRGAPQSDFSPFEIPQVIGMDGCTKARLDVESLLPPLCVMVAA